MVRQLRHNDKAFRLGGKVLAFDNAIPADRLLDKLNNGVPAVVQTWGDSLSQGPANGIGRNLSALIAAKYGLTAANSRIPGYWNSDGVSLEYRMGSMAVSGGAIICKPIACMSDDSVTTNIADTGTATNWSALTTSGQTWRWSATKTYAAGVVRQGSDGQLYYALQAVPAGATYDPTTATSYWAVLPDQDTAIYHPVASNSWNNGQSMAKLWAAGHTLVCGSAHGTHFSLPCVGGKSVGGAYVGGTFTLVANDGTTDYAWDGTLAKGCWQVTGAAVVNPGSATITAAPQRLSAVVWDLSKLVANPQTKNWRFTITWTSGLLTIHPPGWWDTTLRYSIVHLAAGGSNMSYFLSSPNSMDNLRTVFEVNKLVYGGAGLDFLILQEAWEPLWPGCKWPYPLLAQGLAAIQDVYPGLQGCVMSAHGPDAQGTADFQEMYDSILSSYMACAKVAGMGTMNLWALMGSRQEIMDRYGMPNWDIHLGNYTAGNNPWADVAAELARRMGV